MFAAWNPGGFWLMGKKLKATLLVQVSNMEKRSMVTD